MPTTTRLGLPLLAAGQAQKEITHNEALQALDVAVAAGVEEPPRAAPPASPAEGNCFIVSDTPTDGWTGHARQIACYSMGGWRFSTPVEGQLVFVRSSQVFAIYRQSAWDIGTLPGGKLVLDGQQVVGPRLAAISSPSGGTVVDAQCRDALNFVLTALRQHGLIAQ